MTSPESYIPKHLAERILNSRAALEGERKQVTVLFADVAGFTALSARLDPEELHSVMDGCFQHLIEAVHRYEGTVNQFTGDGVMALFGAPIAHEDHAVRAVAAALAIQKALAAYAKRLAAERGIEFGVRIGLNTGPVVVGKIGDDLRMDYTAQGETVNLAARLQAASPTGGVLISEATHRLASQYFVTEARGLLNLKGFDHPVDAFAVTGERTRRARFEAALARGLTPLVGRESELAFLRDCLERVESGRGQVVSLVGEAGVGKSRLVYELNRALRDAELTFLQAHCLPHGESHPFHVVTQFLRATFRLEEGDPEGVQLEKLDREIGRLDSSLRWTAPYLKRLLALPAPELDAEGLDQQQRKRRMLEAVKAFTLRAAAERPVFLLVEDMQWTEPSSEECLRALVDGIAEHRVMIVCTYRTGYAPPWQDRSTHQRLALDPLTRHETAAMVHALLGTSDSRADVIAERAEGNPFFIEELAAYLRESSSKRSRRRSSAEAEIPQTIQDLLTARIDRLPDSLKRTLQRASVLGREFSLSLLEAIGAADGDLAADLAELVSRELLHEKALFPEVRYSFAQPLIRDVAYESLLLKSRAELHGRAGRALERLYASRPEEVLQDLARHYARSNDPAKAVSYLVRSGERAANVFAYADAETSYRQALEVVERTPALGGERAGILERLGDAVFSRGELRESFDHWNQALAALDDASVGRRAADLHRKIGVASFAAGEKNDAIAHLERGLAALDSDLETIEAARLYQEFARISFRLGDNSRATEWAERALALGEKLGAPDVVSHAHNTLCIALARAGDLERGAAEVAKSLDTALAHRLAAFACCAYTNLAVMYVSLDHARSAEYCRQGLELARQIGDQLQQSWLYCALAGGHCTIAGDYDAGVKAAEAAAELDQRLGQRSHLPIPLIILAQIYQCRGELDRSAHYYRQALEVAESIGEPQLLVPCYDGLATLAIESGDDERADHWLAKSRELHERSDAGSDTFLVLPFLC
ncbi:MAG: ATP-binding protein [Candidatus Binatia bacterium]